MPQEGWFGIRILYKTMLAAQYASIKTKQALCFWQLCRGMSSRRWLAPCRSSCRWLMMREMYSPFVSGSLTWRWTRRPLVPSSSLNRNRNQSRSRKRRRYVFMLWWVHVVVGLHSPPQVSRSGDWARHSGLCNFTLQRFQVFRCSGRSFENIAR